MSQVHTHCRHTQITHQGGTTEPFKQLLWSKRGRSSKQPSPSSLGVNRLKSTAQAAEPGVMPAAAGGELTK